MNDGQQADATAKQVDAFIDGNKARSLNDVYKATASSYDSMTNSLNSAVTDAPNGTLSVIDGGTIYDSATGSKFRFEGFDTAETSLNDKAKSLSSELGIDLEDMMNEGAKGKEALQELVDSGKVTQDMLHDNATGLDEHGRVLTSVDFVRNAMVSSGTAAPTSKLDAVAQELYRKAQQRHYDATGETNDIIGDMRDNSLGSRGVLEYNHDVAKGIGSSIVRVGSEVLDLLADAATVTGDGNSEFFDELKTSEGANKAVGLDSRHSNFDVEEIYHQYNTGDYAGALVTGILAGPETLAASSADVLLMAGGVGWLTKGAKLASTATKLQKTTHAIKNIAATNAGLLTWASAKTNTDMEKRAENNDNGEVSMSEVGAGLATNIVMGSLERFAFKKVIGSKQDYADVVKSLQPSSVAKVAGKAIAITGGIAVKGGIEGGQEIIQSTAEILTQEWGTDKYPEYDGLLREENYKQLITAGFLGAGMGVGSGSVPHAGRASYIGAEAGYNYLANKLAKPYNSELKASLSDKEVAGLRADNEQLKELLNNNLNSNASALKNIQDNMDDDGNVDFDALDTDIGKAAVTSTYNRLNQEHIESLDEKSYVELEDKVRHSLVDIINTEIISKLKEGNYDIQEQIDAILPIFNDKADKESFNTLATVLINTYKSGDMGKKKQAYKEFKDAVGYATDGKSDNMASYLTYSNITKGEHAVNHGGNKFVSNLITQARAANQLLENGIKQTKAMDIILDSDTNKSNLAKELSNLNSTDLDGRLNDLIERNLEYEKDSSSSDMSTEQYQVNKTTIDHINKIKKNRETIEKQFKIKLKGSDTKGKVHFIDSFNEESMVTYINSSNRGRLSEAYPDISSTISKIDAVIDEMLSTGSRLSDEDTATVRDFIRHVIDNEHTTSIPKAEALLNKLVLSSNQEYLGSVANNVDLSVNAEERKKLDSLDIGNTFDAVSETTDKQAEVTDEDAKIIAKKLGIYDLLC